MSPDDPNVVQLQFPDGGSVPISREAFDDAEVTAAPIREFLAGVTRGPRPSRPVPPCEPDGRGHPRLLPIWWIGRTSLPVQVRCPCGLSWTDVACPEGWIRVNDEWMAP